jgi:hypothetical protein
MNILTVGNVPGPEMDFIAVERERLPAWPPLVSVPNIWNYSGKSPNGLPLEAHRGVVWP